MGRSRLVSLFVVPAISLLSCPAPAAQDGSPEAAPEEPPGFLDRDGVTGDWGGLRGRLLELGLEPEAIYTLDVMGVASGGIRRDAEVLGNADVSLFVDGEKLAGWTGGSLFVYGLGTHGGNPSDDAGDFQGVDNIAAPDTFKLYEAWIQQEVLDGALSARGGLYDLAAEFDVNETASLFLNGSFGTGPDLCQSGENGPSVFPVTSLALRLRAEPSEGTYVQAAVLDGVPGDPDRPHGTHIRLSGTDGALIAAEGGYEAGGGEDPAHPRRKFALGLWAYTAEFPEIEDETEEEGGNWGAYLLVEETLWHRDDDPGGGLGAFFRAGWANPELNAVEWYLGGGLVLRGPFPGRPDDQIGFGVAAAIPGSEARAAARAAGSPLEDAEVALELTYLFQAARWLAVKPDLQYVIQPGFDPALDDALVLGVRLELTL